MEPLDLKRFKRVEVNALHREAIQLESYLDNAPARSGLSAMNSRSVPHLLLVAGLALVTASADGATPSSRPNILVILADDLGIGDVSAYRPGADVRTPHLDRFAAEGMRFTRMRANATVCSPTRAALMSGCYADRVGVPGLIRTEPANTWGYFDPKVSTLANHLRGTGYHTAIIGKWNLGLTAPGTPNDRGFDFFHGFLGDMMDDYLTHRRNQLNYMREDREVIDPPGHATDLFTAWACAYLEARAAAGQPFFLYLAYNAPHAPIQPPLEWLAKVKQREPQMTEKRAKLVALIEHLDAGIGKVLATLDRTGLASNTLVIFTSDNGGVLADSANNGPWRSEKGHVFEGGLRVPGAVRWPGVVAPGSQTERQTLTMDIFATACVVAGAPVPSSIDGVSFLPTLRGEPASAGDRDYYFVRREGGPAFGGKTIEALRRGQWKLLQDSPFAPLELYHLGADPLEVTNLATQRKQLCNELSAALRQQIQRGGTVPWQPPR